MFIKLGDYKTAKGRVIFALGDGRAVGTEEKSVGMVKVLVGKVGVVVVLLLPIGLAGRVGEFEFRLLGGLGEGRAVGFLLRGDDFRVFVHRVVADDRSAITVGGIELAVTRKATLQFVQ